MQKALVLAKKAYAKDEVPIGALIVDASGTIIARSYNVSQMAHTQTAHAELRALAKAGKAVGDWRLEGCWMYVTLEPCSMCMNALILSRIQGVIYGATSPLFGFEKIAKNDGSRLYKTNTLAIIGGVCKQEAIDLLQQFFKNKRK